MAQQDEIVLKVDIDTSKVAQNIGSATQAIARLKQEQKDLNEQLAEGTITNEEYGRAIAANKAELEQQQRALKSNTAALQANNQVVIDENSSLDDMRQALNAAQKAYAQLSGDEKKAADASGGLREQIEKLTDRVKEQEAAIGDTRRNVGNYAMQSAEAAGKMGFLGKGLAGVATQAKGVTAAFKAASATPLVAVLSVLITIGQKLAESFKGNAAAMEKLNGLMGAFAGVGNIVNVLIDKIAQGIGWLAEKITALIGKMGDWAESVKAGKEIAEQELEVIKEEQKVALENAESQKKIAELKAQAAEKDKLTAKQRLDLLQQASDEEEAISRRQYELAEKQYELQVKKNAQSESSQEDLKKENDLRIAMINAETALFNKRKELAGQMAELRAQEKKAIEADLAERDKLTKEAAIRHMEDLRLIAQAEAETIKAQGEELAKQAKEMLESLTEEEEEEEIPTPDQMTAKMFGLDAEGVAYFRELLDQGVSFAEAKTKAITDQTQRMTQGFATSFGQMGNAFTQMGDALGEFAEENKDAAVAQKAFTFTGILLNQAQAISEGALAIAKGVESASAIPFPGNIPAIISIVAQISGMIAGVMSSIVQAKQIFAEADTQKFATGGIVGGNSYTGDHVPVMANSGEMWINSESQKRLFDALTGNGDGSLGINYELMAQAIAAQPAPVVVYTELQEFGQKVATYNEIAEV